MRWRRWLGFAVLCGGQATLGRSPPVSGGPSALGRIAVGCLLVALCSAVGLVVVRRGRFLAEGWPGVAVVSAMSIGVPAVLMRYAKEYSSDTNTSIVFALTPVVVALAWGAMSKEQAGLSALIPGLAGAAGVLVLLPYELPVSGSAWGALAEAIAAMVLGGCGVVWLHRLAAGRSLAGVIFVGAMTNVILLSLCGAWSWSAWSDAVTVQTWGWSVWIAIAIEAGMVALTLWLGSEMAPVRFSARFLVVPLVTILEGAVLLRPGVDVWLVVGVVLLMVSVWWLLVHDGRVDEKVLTLR